MKQQKRNWSVAKKVSLHELISDINKCKLIGRIEFICNGRFRCGQFFNRRIRNLNSKSIVICKHATNHTKKVNCLESCDKVKGAKCEKV